MLWNIGQEPFVDCLLRQALQECIISLCLAVTSLCHVIQAKGMLEVKRLAVELRVWFANTRSTFQRPPFFPAFNNSIVAGKKGGGGLWRTLCLQSNIEEVLSLSFSIPIFLFWFSNSSSFLSSKVCGLLTPLHIVPEWYFLCQYSYVTVALVDPSAEFL